MQSDRASFIPTDGVSSSLQRVRPLHGRTTGPTRRSTKGQWSPEEDEILCKAVQQYKGKNWKKIAECFKDRTDVQCLHRWQKVLNPELVKGPWSKEEDEIIIEMVDKYGPKKWSTIAQHLPGRIGKQCRERWHNHLNPSINKEAWTQEEELALIRAHQIYGNKWAELTKFLPGRTDNAIKNHWNSSVKKKLDSYLASGLLSQFPAFPNVNNANQMMLCTTSMKQPQSSEDKSGCREGKEVDEVSECCSQGSTLAGGSQSTTEMGSSVVHETNEEREVKVDTSHEKDKKTLNAFQEVASSSQFIDQTVGNEIRASVSKDCRLNPDSIPDISELDLIQVQSGFYMQFLTSCEDHGVSMSQNAMDLGNVNHVECSDTQDGMFNMESGLCGILHTGETENHQCCFPNSGNGTISGVEESFQVPVMFGVDSHQLINSSVEDVRQDAVTCDNSVYTSVGGNGTDSHGPNNQLDQYTQENDPQRLVHVNDFGQTIFPVNEQQHIVKEEKRDPGGLCYEPPRFPSLDVPFFSCDLIQSGTDMQQEYSPLGIRQLMMSSTNCLTPFKLWDSPTRDTSPDAVLKSAAKTFSCTPSILKKRHRDLLSPMSEKRSEKKHDSDHLSRDFSDLARNFSRLEVMVDARDVKNETASSPLTTQKLISEDSIEDKENMDPASEGTTDRDLEIGSIKVDVDDDATIHVQQTTGVLVEREKDDHLFLSPDQFGSKSDRVITTKGLGTPLLDRLETVSSNKGSLFSSSESPSCFSLVCSPRFYAKRDGSNLAVATSVQSVPASQVVGECSGNGAGLDNNYISMYGDTPFRRSMESPSAWKSPWFINSFLSSPRVDTEITLEDFGFLFSPGERSYDAIGLMKQLSEQTAATFANAQEILGDETPESILRGRCPKNMEGVPSSSLLASSPLTERRTLDFSECGTPGKKAENGKLSGGSGSSAISSSPSSYLLRECR
ncbi:unnamed protein product [Cuscuta epithymum]|uniref:Uncharacterized protein n=2 Tax=Cuscuta epithymum TaxID=186058 RepID=A0AAV0C560_9ASTE|nr:unnamed protein product [Cuscuta epithymum]